MQQSQSVPAFSSARKPSKILDAQRLIDETPEIVPNAVVERAFHRFDMDGDGMASLDDLLNFTAAKSVKDINKAMLQQMVDECVAARAIGGLSSDEGRNQFKDRVSAKDVRGAVGFRRIQVAQRPSKTFGKSRRKEWLPRPFQHFWLGLIEAALPDEPILVPSSTEIFSLPIMSEREKNDARIAAQGNDGETSVGSVRSGFQSLGLTTVASMSVAADGGPRKPRKQTFRGDEAWSALSAAVRHKRPRCKADGAVKDEKASDFHGTRGIAMAAMALTQKVESCEGDNPPVMRIGFDAQEEQRKIELSLLATSQGAARSTEVRENLAKMLAKEKRQAKQVKPDFNRTFHRKTIEADWAKKQQQISRMMAADNKGWSNKKTAFEDNMRKNDRVERAEIRACGKSEWRGFIQMESCQTLCSKIGLNQKGFHGVSATVAPEMAFF